MFKMTDEMFNDFMSNFDKEDYRDMVVHTLFPGLGMIHDRLSVCGGLRYPVLYQTSIFTIDIVSGLSMQISVYDAITSIYDNIMRPIYFYNTLEFVHRNIDSIKSTLDEIDTSTDYDYIPIREFKVTLDKMNYLYQTYRNGVRHKMRGDYIMYGVQDGEVIAPLTDISLVDAINNIMFTFTDSINMRFDPANGSNGLEIAKEYIKNATTDPFNDKYTTIKGLIIDTLDRYDINECELDDFEGPITFAWTVKGDGDQIHTYDLKIMCRKNTYHCV